MKQGQGGSSLPIILKTMVLHHKYKSDLLLCIVSRTKALNQQLLLMALGGREGEELMVIVLISHQNIYLCAFPGNGFHTYNILKNFEDTVVLLKQNHISKQHYRVATEVGVFIHRITSMLKLWCKSINVFFI